MLIKSMEKRGVFEPIEIGDIVAGRAIAARVHADVHTGETAGDRRAEHSPIHLFRECLPIFRFRRDVETVRLIMRLNLEIK